LKEKETVRENPQKQKKKKSPALPVWAGSQTNAHNAEIALFMNVAVRLALLCLTTAGIVLLLIQLYKLPVEPVAVIFLTVIASLFFNTLFIFLKFRYALPSIVILFYFLFPIMRVEKVLYNLGCIADYLLITLNGGMLNTAAYSSRPEIMIYRMTWEFRQSLQDGVVFIAVAFALIFAIAARGKFIGSILITAIILVIPSIAAQKATFVPAITILTAGMFGLYSIWASQEQSFLKAVKDRGKKRWPLIPMIHRHSVNGAVMACIALAACFIAQALLPVEKTRDTIDFWIRQKDAVLDRLVDIGDVFGGGLGAVAVPMLDSSGYMPGGGIDASGTLVINAPNTSRREVLSVSYEDNENTLYLRNGIGTTFNPERGEWNVQNRADSMRDFPDNFYPEHEYLIFRQKVGLFDFDADSFIGRQSVNVQYLVRTRHIMLPTSPFMPRYKEDERFVWRGDTILERRGSPRVESYSWDVLYPKDSELFGSAVGSVEYLITSERAMNADEESIYPTLGRFEDYIILEFASTQDTEGGALRIYVGEYGLGAAEYLALLTDYEDMVYELYTQTAEAETENMRTMLNTIPELTLLNHTVSFNPTAYMKAKTIEDHFKHNFTYSLTVDNNAGESSMLGNFLFETKSGHCALYATAMTLMLREMGIPARYVTGYVTGGGRGRVSGAGFTHTVLERDLHAWVEVYFKGVGWLPFDPTPPIHEYVFLDAEREFGSGTTSATTPRYTLPEERTTPPELTENPEVTTPQPITDTTDTSAETSETESDILPPDEGEDDNNTLPLEILIIALILLPAILILLSVFMFLRGLNRVERRRIAKYTNLHERAAAREAYRFILKLLKTEGLRGEAGETPVRFAARVDEAIQTAGLSSVIAVIEKLEFSREDLSGAEYKKLSETATELYRQIVTEQKRVKRFVRRIIMVDIIK